jgi:predicted nucleotidyltransferase
MQKFYLKSGECVDLGKLLESLISIGWGVKNINSIVVFGSAARSPKSIRNIKKKKFLWFEWESYETVYNRPNDIDVLVIYNDLVTEQESNLKQDNKVALMVYDGYGGMLEEGLRVSNLHLFRTSNEKFEERLSENESQAMSVFRDGVLIMGNNKLILNRCSSRDYLTTDSASFEEYWLSTNH